MLPVDCRSSQFTLCLLSCCNLIRDGSAFCKIERWIKFEWKCGHCFIHQFWFCYNCSQKRANNLIGHISVCVCGVLDSFSVCTSLTHAEITVKHLMEYTVYVYTRNIRYIQYTASATMREKIKPKQIKAHRTLSALLLSIQCELSLILALFSLNHHCGTM